MDQRTEYHHRRLYPRASNPACLAPQTLPTAQNQSVWRLPRRCLVSRLTLSVPPSPRQPADVFSPHHSTIVCSIIRVTVNSRINLDDVTWSYVASTIWSTIEGDVGVICACLPVLAPVLHIFTDRFGSTPSSSAAPRSKKAYRRPSGLEDSADFAPLEEDTTQLFPIRKTVEVQTVAADGGVEGRAFDVRRPGDT